MKRGRTRLLLLGARLTSVCAFLTRPAGWRSTGGFTTAESLPVATKGCSPSSVPSSFGTGRASWLGQQEANDYWYKDGVRFKCTECGKCCKTRGDVWLNPDEVAQAANATRLDAQGFLHIYSEEVVQGWARLKNRRGPDGVSDGACIFLNSANQCSIYEARPLQCRTYPYWPRVIKSRASWDEEAVVEDDKEGKHWNPEDGGCEGINHPEGEVVDFVHIRNSLIKQAYYYRDFPL